MINPEQQSNSDLQTLGTEVALVSEEIEVFRRLPKEEQEKQKDKKLIKLRELNDNLDQAIQEAVQTGELNEAKRLKDLLKEKIQEFEDLINTIGSPLFKNIREIVADLEITSLETAIAKLKNAGCDIGAEEYWMLEKVDWSKKEKSDFRITFFPVESLFGDKKEHKYDEILNKAKQLGFEIVPAGNVPEICINLIDIKNKDIWIAMDPILNKRNEPSIYRVGHQAVKEGGLWLGTYPGNFDKHYSGEYHFVFVYLDKKSRKI